MADGPTLLTMPETTEGHRTGVAAAHASCMTHIRTLALAHTWDICYDSVLERWRAERLDGAMRSTSAEQWLVEAAATRYEAGYPAR